MSFIILNVKSAYSLESIHDENLTINGISCIFNIADMYFNNDFLFLEKDVGYHNRSLEIYNVSNPEEMDLMKTYEHNRSSCSYQSSNNCLTGNENYTFLQIEYLAYERSLVAFDVNSPNLTHMKTILPNSSYIIKQIIADNEYLYLVMRHSNWATDWQIEKYKINNPFSLSLVSNVSVSRSSYLYAKDNNLFVFNGGNINNWTNPHATDRSRIKDAHYENNRLFIMIEEYFYGESYYGGLLVIDVTNNESYQVLANYPLTFVANFDVVENNIFIATTKKIIALENMDYDNFKKLDSYSFEHIWGTLEIMCYGNDLLFIGKLSCQGGYKDEDKVSLVILDVENPRKILAVFPEGFNNKFQFFIDGSVVSWVIVVFVLPIIVPTTIIISLVFIIRRKMKKKL